MLTSRPIGLRITRLRDGDTRTVQRVFAGMSAASAFARFGTGMSSLQPSFAARLATVHPGRQEVLVARVRGRPVGLARWTLGPSGAAEAAIEVVDVWQDAGIGRELVRALAEDARRAGIGWLEAHVDRDNRRVWAWVTRLGAWRAPDGGFVIAVGDLLDAVVVA